MPLGDIKNCLNWKNGVYEMNRVSQEQSCYVQLSAVL